MTASFPGPSPVRVRHARTDDAPALAEIRIRGWQTAYRGQVPDQLLDSLSVEFDQVRFADHVEHLAADRRVWVAEADGAVAGFASTGPSRDEDTPGAGEIYAIYVRPGLYGRGIGAALLTHAVHEMRQDGYMRAVLWTLTSNAAARRFYQREGWAADGSEKLDNLSGHDLAEVRYTIDLGPTR